MLIEAVRTERSSPIAGTPKPLRLIGLVSISVSDLCELFDDFACFAPTKRGPLLV